MTGMMKFIRPIVVTDNMDFTTNVTEDDHGIYAAGTSYGLGDRVILTTGYHRIYESLRAANTGNNPPDNLIGDDPWWKDVSATNAWKVFDGKSRASTTRAGSIVNSLAPGKLFNSLALLNIDAVEVNIVVTHPTEGIVYEVDIDMVDNSFINDWYDWFFSEPIRKSNIVLLDLPAYPDATVQITATDSTGTVSIGEWALGVQSEIGKLLYDYSVGMIDYSSKSKDDEGNATIFERTYSNTPNFALRIDSARVYAVKKKLESYRATGIVWIGSEDQQESIVYGFIKSLNVVIKGHLHSLCSLEIEELS